MTEFVTPAPLLSSIVNLNTPDHYLHWGFILVSVANFLVIVAMVVLFALALGVPFFIGRRHPDLPPAPRHAPDDQAVAPPPSSREPQAWTTRVRRAWLRRLPPEKLLPDTQPAYVSSWIYVFGVLTLAGLIIAIVSGMVLALEGPVWWHTSSIGLFVNSLHLGSVECFMGFMAIHLWGKYWMAAWRGGRALTWMTGVVAFLVAVFEAFTGYLSQTNFDSQWIAFESKDAMNGSGIGAFLNTMNFGQALMLHIVFVPIVLLLIVGLHIIFVRLRGVVHPIDADPAHLASEDADAHEILGRASGTGAPSATPPHAPPSTPEVAR